MSNKTKDYRAEIAKKKFVVLKRAERRLQNRLDDIDWEYSVLKPELETLDKAITVGRIPEFTLVENNES